MRGTSSDRCVFITTSDRARELATAHASEQRWTEYAVADWHAEFRRFGASELNERFEKMFGRPMTAAAWHGWVAVKAVLEAALRDDDICEGLSRLRFDGHKGRVLRFDPASRQLLHPPLIVRQQEGKTMLEVVP